MAVPQHHGHVFHLVWDSIAVLILDPVVVAIVVLQYELDDAESEEHLPVVREASELDLVRVVQVL